ncbi:MAG: HAD family phosphatase [Bacteriovoracaceae bacterium]|nr:HAD family phosphatase [Bacteriovoracaceae bacterium]
MKTKCRPQKSINYLKSKQAVMFDMDGTLFDTEPLHAQAFRQVLLEEQMDLSAEELESRFYGYADPAVFEELLGKNCDSEGLVFRKNEVLKQAISMLSTEELLKLQVPGMLELLKELKSSGLKLALISASENEIVNLMVKHSGIAPYLDTVVGRNDTGRSKPHPDPYFFAMEKLAVDPDNSLIFEDSPTGLEAARESGAEVIAIDPKCDEEEDRDAIANYSWLK